MPQELYPGELAKMGTSHDPAYYDLPPHLRGLIDAAHAARGAFCALGEACRLARVEGVESEADTLDTLELGAWNSWQELERRGRELLGTRLQGMGGRRGSQPTSLIEQGWRLLERWYLNSSLSLAGERRLRALMGAEADAYPYWSGGELIGTACVWANGRRYVLDAWNAESDTIEAGGHQDVPAEDPGAAHE